MSQESFHLKDSNPETFPSVEEAYDIAWDAHLDPIPTDWEIACEKGVPSEQLEKATSISYEQRIADLSTCERLLESIIGESRDADIDQLDTTRKAIAALSSEVATLQNEGFYILSLSAAETEQLQVEQDALTEVIDRLSRELDDLDSLPSDLTPAESALVKLQVEKAGYRAKADARAQEVLDEINA